MFVQGGAVHGLADSGSTGEDGSLSLEGWLSLSLFLSFSLSLFLSFSLSLFLSFANSLIR